MLVFATVVRPFFAELSITYTYLGIANSIALGLVALLFFFAKPRALYVYILSLLCLFQLIFITTFSGGINSHFSVLLPSIPVFCCLLQGTRVALISAFFTIFYVLMLNFYDGVLISFDAFEYYEVQLNARTFWLCLSIVMSTFFCVQFDSMTSQLSDGLSVQANIDSLTGLLNRRKIMKVLGEVYATALDKDQYLSVLMLDVDHFKKLNDTHGHLFGDQCLVEVANTIQGSVRQNTDYVGRFGGEEFLVLLSNVSPELTQNIAEKIRKNIANSAVPLKDEVIQLTATIGYACVRAKEVDKISSLISMADKALYTGKEAGRDRVVSAA